MAWLTALFHRSMVINLAIAVAAFVVFWLANTGYDVSLREAQYFSGWVLTVCMLVLFLLTLRKRVVILPFGRVRGWLSLHYYLGFATLAVFLVHTHFRFPDSPLEWQLWLLFVLIGLSGVIGALLTKLVPLRLEAHGERIIFERIPIFREELRAEAEATALESVKDGNTVTIAELYTNTLVNYFDRPRNVVSHLLGSKSPLARIERALDSVERYLDDAGKARLAKLRELVETKDNLDFQYANGGLLKVWLFFHVPATWAVLVTMVVHIVVAYAFSAGVA